MKQLERVVYGGVERQVFVAGQGWDANGAPVAVPPHERCGRCVKCEQEGGDGEPPLCPICDTVASASCYGCGWRAQILEPPRPKPCLEPEKMNGYADQFPGSDYE